MNFETILSSYDYPLPPELIAKEPVHPRDAARLLIYDRKTDSVHFDVFTNIGKYLPQNSVLVFNRTKVIPAKFRLRKETGGKVDVLYLGEAPHGIETLASGSIKAGDTLEHVSGIRFRVLERNDQRALLKMQNSEHKIISFLESHGETPLPPYMSDSPMNETERRAEYQTVFADQNGSVAAPTAGLHFTKELITRLEQDGHEMHYVTLHVNLGTFAPLTEDQWRSKKLHTEHYVIDPKTSRALIKAKRSGRKVVAVGTTTVRTLESAWDGESLSKSEGSTDLFLTEDSPLHVVDGLITNFHVPRSSLLMLVSAFTGREKLLELYGQAVRKKMRFFSFGDGMLIL